MGTLLHRKTDLPSLHRMGKRWRIISFHFFLPLLVIGKRTESSGWSLPAICLVQGRENAKEQINSKHSRDTRFNKSKRKTEATAGKTSLAGE